VVTPYWPTRSCVITGYKNFGKNQRPVMCWMLLFWRNKIHHVYQKRKHEVAKEDWGKPLFLSEFQLATSWSHALGYHTLWKDNIKINKFRYYHAQWWWAVVLVSLVKGALSQCTCADILQPVLCRKQLCNFSYVTLDWTATTACPVLSYVAHPLYVNIMPW
jgi:hypothetical protein